MTAPHTVSVVLAPHEREGMRQLVSIARSLADVIAKDERFAARVRVHAKAVEDVLTRLDTARQNAGTAPPPSNASKE